MKFSIYNLTDTPIEASTRRLRDVGVAVEEANLNHTIHILHPRRSTTIPKLRGSHIHLHAALSKQDLETEGKVASFPVSLPGFWAKRGASWKEVNVSRTPEECPWRVYWFWPAKALMVLPRRNIASFLSDMPDTLSLASLMLPGTHDTMAFHGWPISQCQTPRTPLSAQLLQGIRVIDVRLAVVPIIPVPGRPAGTSTLPTPQFKLIAYHGIYPQRTPFTTILSTLHTYLTSPAGCRETVVMSIKQEDFTKHAPTLFSRLAREEIQAGPGGFGNTDPATGQRDMGMWYLQNRIPTLGEVRGKVVLFSRFGVNGEEWEGGWEGLGIHPLRWPDSQKSGFVWDLKGMRIRTHDWYAIPSFLAVPEKATLATMCLRPTVPWPLSFPLVPDPGNPKEGEKKPDGEGKLKGEVGEVNETELEGGVVADGPVLNITYLSAATFPLALPPTVAKGLGWPGFKLGFEGVNARVGRWLLEELVPDLKTHSPIKSADAPDTTENGHGALKQDKEVNERQKERVKGMRWFRSKDKGMESKSSLLVSTERISRGDGDKDDVHLVNEADTDILAESNRLRGWALLDYYSVEQGLVPLLVEFNHQGRKGGEEGWP